MSDMPVYWDNENKAFYYVEWVETGNNDIPVRHYIEYHNIVPISRNIVENFAVG